ncbi:MAG: YbaN family protein [Xanthobacteraceae bacterium]
MIFVLKGQASGNLMRIAYFGLGWVMVALGVIGLVMPLMPGTVFLIIAAACFARSSPRLEAWLLDHPRFGKSLRDWRTAGAIPRSAKAMACAGMTVGFFVFWYSVDPSPPLAAVVGLSFLACAAYVVSRPAAGEGSSV